MSDIVKTLPVMFRLPAAALCVVLLLSHPIRKEAATQADVTQSAGWLLCLFEKLVQLWHAACVLLGSAHATSYQAHVRCMMSAASVSPISNIIQTYDASEHSLTKGNASEEPDNFDACH